MAPWAYKKLCSGHAFITLHAAAAMKRQSRSQAQPCMAQLLNRYSLCKLSNPVFYSRVLRGYPGVTWLRGFSSFFLTLLIPIPPGNISLGIVLRRLPGPKVFDKASGISRNGNTRFYICSDDLTGANHQGKSRYFPRSSNWRSSPSMAWL